MTGFQTVDGQAVRDDEEDQDMEEGGGVYVRMMDSEQRKEDDEYDLRVGRVGTVVPAFDWHLGDDGFAAIERTSGRGNVVNVVPPVRGTDGICISRSYPWLSPWRWDLCGANLSR
jgi:hypothetical protein